MTKSGVHFGDRPRPPRVRGLLLACAYALLLLAPISDARRGHPALAAAATAAAQAEDARAGATAVADDPACELCALLAGALRHAIAPAAPAAVAAPPATAPPPVEAALRATPSLLALGSRAPPLA